MNRPNRHHSVFMKVLWALLALAVGQAVLVFYYLDSWLTMPLL
jgi:hypothetical protein